MDLNMMSFSDLEIFAIIIIVFLVLRFLKFVFKVVFIYAIGPIICPVDFKAQGKWALVTGCTDGIGKEYARQLAEKGLNIVLISRSLEKLRATADEIEKEYHVATKIIQADFSNGDNIYKTIENKISGLEIGTLVNNVGVSYTYPEYFADIPDSDNLFKRLIQVNIVAMTKLTRMILPGMLKRNRGVIINVGSMSCTIPNPMLTVYAATKAYVDKFTECLQMEYKDKDIYIQCVIPGFVCTKMSGIRSSSFFAPNARDYVKSALSLTGYSIRTPGYFPHALLTAITNGIYTISSDFGIWLITRSLQNTRRKYLKKYKNK